MDYSFLESKVKNQKKETDDKYSFLKKKEKVIEEKTSQDKARLATLPQHLGGGEYLVGRPNEVVRSERGYADLPAVGTAERDHIISVALGGTSDKNNLQYLATTKDGRQEGKVSVEQKAINDYTSGKISLGEARLKVATKQQQIKGLTPTVEEQTVKGQLKKMFSFKGIKEGIKRLQAEGEQATEKMRAETSYEDKARMGIYGLDEKQRVDLERKKYQQTPEGQLEQALTKEKEIERAAKIVTAPIRFTAGSLASGLVSYGLEKADSDLKYTPKTDAEKLLISDIDIQRLKNQEDLYGIITRASSVPVALTAMAILENPFIQGTGMKSLIKNKIEKEIAQNISKFGAETIIKYANDVIRAEVKAGKMEKEIGEKVLKDINNFRVVEPSSEVKQVKATKEIEEPLIQETKKYKSADEFIKAQATKENVATRFGKIDKKGAYFSQSEKGIGNNNYFNAKTSKGVKNSQYDISNLNIVKSGTPEARNILDEALKDSKNTQRDINILKRELNNPDNQKSALIDWRMNDEIPSIVKASKKLGYDGIKVLETGDISNPTSIFIWNTNKIKELKTKQELTDIWNKANELTLPKQKKEPIVYDNLIKEKSVPKRIGNEVIEKGLVDDLGEIPTYDKVTFKDQAKLVGEIIDENPEKAFKIAIGEELPTNGVLPESVFVAVKNQAIKNGDIDVLRQLATAEKGVAQEATVLGQRIKMLDEKLEDDAFKNINDVIKSRNKKLEKNGVKVKELKAKEIKKIKSEVAKAKPIKDEWLDFINSIKC